MKLLLSCALALFTGLTLRAENAPDAGRKDLRPGDVDAGSMRAKVLCGYQGWFRCPGDWYLRLVGEGTRMLHEKSVTPAQTPIHP